MSDSSLLEVRIWSWEEKQERQKGQQKKKREKTKNGILNLTTWKAIPKKREKVCWSLLSVWNLWYIWTFLKQKINNSHECPFKVNLIMTSSSVGFMRLYAIFWRKKIQQNWLWKTYLHLQIMTSLTKLSSVSVNIRDAFLSRCLTLKLVTMETVNAKSTHVLMTYRAMCII